MSVRFQDGDTSKHEPGFNDNGEVLRPGISPKFLRQHGIRHVNEDDAFALVDSRSSGIAIPYCTLTSLKLMVNGRHFHRLRLDHPTASAKYLSPKGSGAQLFIPQGRPFGLELVIAEGEFKAMALCESGVCAVGVGGIFSSMPKGELLPELTKILRKFKPHIIYFLGDADTCLNFEFSREAIKLAKALPASCTLKLPRIPLSLPNGIDDVKETLGNEFLTFWEEMKATAIEVPSKMDLNALANKLAIEQLPIIKGLPNGRQMYLSRIVTFAIQLDALTLGELAQAAKDHLGTSVCDLRRAVKQAAADQEQKSAEKIRQQQQRCEKEKDENSDENFLGPNGVILPSGHVSFTNCATRLFSILKDSKKFYLSSGVVCRLENKDGSLSLDVLTDYAFRSAIEQFAKLFAWRAGWHKESIFLKPGARCSLDNAKTILACNARELLPPVAAIHNCPLMVESPEGGVKVLPKGYHSEAGGRLIAGGDMPEQMEIDEATSLLSEIFEEFDFVTPSDKSRALAALVSPAIKGLGTFHVPFPIFIIEANDSQAGKGFLLDLINAIYRESPSLVTQRTGGVGGFDESLSQALINAKPFVRFDNIRGNINSTFLEAIMTCPLGSTVAARVPHKGEIRVAPHNFTFQLTSNGLATTRDLVNRACFIRILKRQDYAFRAYAEGSILEHIQANQVRFLSAVYSVLPPWIAHGKPRTSTDTRGEGAFRCWWQTFDWILTNFFDLPSPLDGHEVAQARAANPTLVWLRELYIKLSALHRPEEWLSATEIVEFCETEELEIPGSSPDQQESKASLNAALRVGRLMGTLFKEKDCVQGEGFEIHRTEETHYIESSRQEKAFKKYAFYQG